VDWRSVVTLYNYAPIPPPSSKTTIAGWNRGFNLVILAGRAPKYFVKCRPANDATLKRETVIRTSLAGNRPHGVSVAPVRGASSARIAIQVSPFLKGPHFGRVVETQSPAAYIATLRSVLEGAAELSRLAVRDCALVRSPTSTINLPESAAEILANVATLASLSADEQAALAGVVAEAGTVPARPQHGDFWWQNLIMDGGQLWAIDFDSYGDIQVPLFDDLTLALTTIGVRAGGTVQGLDRIISADDEAREWRRLVVDRALADGLSESQLDGLLTYYLAKMAATVHRRGGAAFSAHHVDAVRWIAKRLEAGQRGLLRVG
jgi:hypothetical protein